MMVQHWEKVIHSQNGKTIEKLFLSTLSVPYATLVRARNFAYDHQWLKVEKAPVPVISVGNLSVGGSGKTPLVMWCAQILRENGRKPAIFSRGYGRSNEKKIKVVSNGREILENVFGAGDEPILMAKRCAGVPVIVGANRTEAIFRSAKYLDIDCALLDDGFQHRKCGRNVDIVAMDPSILSAPHLFPRGSLREHVISLDRADFIAIKNGDEDFLDSFENQFSYRLRKEVSFFSYKISAVKDLKEGKLYNEDFLKNKNVSIFCALANPKGFVELIHSCGANVIGTDFFRDHHTFTLDELKTLEQKGSQGNTLLVTTEKDSVKLPPNFPAFIVEVKLEWKKGEERLKELLLRSKE